MFEKIFELIKGVESIELAKERLADADVVVIEKTPHSIRVIQGDDFCVVLELWGPTMLVRGIDKDGYPNQLVTHSAFAI